MTNLKIDYIEFQMPELGPSKAFFEKAFGWNFVDYGPTYQAFDKTAGIDGGINNQIEGEVKPPLVILKADDLEAALESVKGAGGTILADIFPFPGGRRFHFREPGGNEMAVWSEK